MFLNRNKSFNYFQVLDFFIFSLYTPPALQVLVIWNYDKEQWSKYLIGLKGSFAQNPLYGNISVMLPACSVSLGHRNLCQHGSTVIFIYCGCHCQMVENINIPDSKVTSADVLFCFYQKYKSHKRLTWEPDFIVLQQGLFFYQLSQQWNYFGI